MPFPSSPFCHPILTNNRSTNFKNIILIFTLCYFYDCSSFLCRWLYISIYTYCRKKMRLLRYCYCCYCLRSTFYNVHSPFMLDSVSFFSSFHSLGVHLNISVYILQKRKRKRNRTNPNIIFGILIFFSLCLASLQHLLSIILLYLFSRSQYISKGWTR